MIISTFSPEGTNTMNRFNSIVPVDEYLGRCCLHLANSLSGSCYCYHAYVVFVLLPMTVCECVSAFLDSGQQCVILSEWRSDPVAGTQRGIHSVWGDSLFCWIVSDLVSSSAAKLFYCWCRRFCFKSAQVRVFVVSAVWRTATTSSSGSITTSGLLLITEPHSFESSGDATDNSARVEVTFLCDSNTVISHWINDLLNPYVKVHVKNTNA